MTSFTAAQPIAELFKAAEIGYQKREDSITGDKLTQHMVSKGTHQDKISALSQQLESGTPIKPLQSLVQLTDYNKHRKESLLSIEALSQHFQKSLGAVQKYHHFSESIVRTKQSKKKVLSIDQLVQFYIDHKAKGLYQIFVKNVEGLLSHDLWFLKKAGISTLCQLVRFEQLRSTLLSSLINKFGDKDLRSINFLTKELRDFSMHEFKCIEQMLREIEATMFRKNVSQECQFYCLNFLNNLNIKIMHESQLVVLFKLYFKIFTRITLSDDDNQLSSKLFLNTVKGLNKLFPVIKGEFSEFIGVFNEKADFIYRTIHTTTNTKVKIQLLLFLYQTLGSLNQELPDRYFNCLYTFLNDSTLLNTSLLELFFDLLLISVKHDNNLPRVHAFVKRLLQLCFEAQPPFIITSLILLSKLQDKVEPLLTKREGYLLEQGDIYEPYDMFKRESQHAKASNSCLWQLMPFKYHFHPTVRKFAEMILAQQPIEYTSNPLLDFSSTNFVEKVCLKSEKKSEGWKLKNYKLINRIRPSKYDTLINKPLETLALDEEFLRRYLEKKTQVRSNRKSIKDIEEYADNVIEKEIDRLQGREVDEEEGEYSDLGDDAMDEGEYDEEEGGYEDEDEDMEQQFADEDFEGEDGEDFGSEEGMGEEMEDDEDQQEEVEESEQEKGFNQMFNEIDKDDDMFAKKRRGKDKVRHNNKPNQSAQTNSKDRTQTGKGRPQFSKGRAPTANKGPPKTKHIQKRKPQRR